MAAAATVAADGPGPSFVPRDISLSSRMNSKKKSGRSRPAVNCANVQILDGAPPIGDINRSIEKMSIGTYTTAISGGGGGGVAGNQHCGMPPQNSAQSGQTMPSNANRYVKLLIQYFTRRKHFSEYLFLQNLAESS